MFMYVCMHARLYLYIYIYISERRSLFAQNIFHYLYLYIFLYIRETFTICIYASLTARSLTTLVTPQRNPTMCKRTSCAQVHELP